MTVLPSPVIRALPLLSLLVLVSAASIPTLFSSSISSSGLFPRDGNFSDPIPPQCYLKCRADLLSIANCNYTTNATCLCFDQAFLDAGYQCVLDHCDVLDRLTSLRYETTVVCPVPPANRSDLIANVSWGLFAIAAFATTLRVMSRLPCLGGTGYGLDDYTCIAALLLLIPGSVCVHMMTLNGLGQHMWMVPPEQINTMHLWFWISGYLYTYVLIGTKTSILLLYLRMWPGEDGCNQTFRAACYSLIAILVAAMLVVTVVWSLECTPTYYIWIRWTGGMQDHCLAGSEADQALVYAALHICLDFVVVTLPIPKLLKISFASTRKKVAVCIAFSAGLALTVCSIVRVPYVDDWSTSLDDTWVYGDISMWSNIEASVTIFSACVPAMMGLFQRTWVHYSTGAPFRSYRNSMGEGPYELRLRSGCVSGQMDRNDDSQDAKRISSPYPYHVGGYDLNSGKDWPATHAADNGSVDSPVDGTEHDCTGFHFRATKRLPALSQPVHDDQGVRCPPTEPMTFLDHGSDDLPDEGFNLGATAPLPPVEQEEEPATGFRVDPTRPLPPPTRQERRVARQEARQAVKKK